MVAGNAGLGTFRTAEELTDPEIDHVIATNLNVSVQLIRAVPPHLRARVGGRMEPLASCPAIWQSSLAGHLPRLTSPGILIAERQHP